jgi:hypothetical protein
MNVVPIKPAETVPDGRAKPKKRSYLRGRERWEDVKAVYRNPNTLSFIGRAVDKKGSGGQIWAMILAAIDAGFAAPTDMCLSWTRDGLPLRVLFTGAVVGKGPGGYFNRYLLTNPKHRNYVKEVIWPIALANKETVKADPDKLPALVRSRENPEAALRIATAVASMPSHEQEVTMFGERLWPNGGSYSYDQLRAACWYFVDQDSAFKLAPQYADPMSRAIAVRFSTRWFRQYAEREINDPASRSKIRQVYDLVDRITLAMERNPAGECIVPSRPTAEGKW